MAPRNGRYASIIGCAVPLTLLSLASGVEAAVPQPALITPAREANITVLPQADRGGVGAAVAAIGDVNGDGYPDFAVGAPSGLSDRGSVYVIFGRRPDARVDARRLGRRGVRIDGARTLTRFGAGGDQIGRSLAGAGDVNGDGVDDLLLGAQFASHNGREQSGSAYVVFGRRLWPRRLALAKLGRGGFRIDGPRGYNGATGDPGSQAGGTIAGIGDVNGDRRADVAIGTGGGPNLVSAAEAFVVFGAGSSATVDLAALGVRGYRIEGFSRRFLGAPSVPVAAVGDLNRDGRGDVLVGDRAADIASRTDSGAAHVVYGKPSTTPVRVDALGARGLTIGGAAASDLAGDSVASAGDVNGDKIPDLVVGATGTDPPGRADAGSVYVVYGRRGPGLIDLADQRFGGFRIDHPYPGSFFCQKTCADPPGNPPVMAGAGDVNGDRRSDILVSFLELTDRDVRGVAHLVLAPASPKNVDLGAPARARVIRLLTTRDQEGFPAIGGLPDLNGDGRAEILFGESDRRVTDKRQGAAYVVFGPARGRCANRRLGTNREDELNGSAFGERILGRRGTDRINARAGDDCVQGGPGRDRISLGPGDDTVRAGDGARDRVRCGTGNDTALVDPFDRLHACERVRRLRDRTQTRAG